MRRMINGSVIAAVLLAGCMTPSGIAPIRVGETLSIEFESVPKETIEQPVVQPDGTIALPMIGKHLAAGKTLAQLDAELDKIFSEIGYRPITVRVSRSGR